MMDRWEKLESAALGGLGWNDMPPGLYRMLSDLRRVIDTGTRTILLVGESGTGKTRLARTIHYCSAYPEAPFLTLNCTTTTRDLLEAELFGAPAGVLEGMDEPKSGLLELAGRGTLFLDAAFELPVELQARLMKVLQTETPKVQCRILAATPQRLRTEKRPESVDSDFFDTLTRHAVEVPPLRRRGKDLEVLTREFLTQWATQHDAPVPSLTPDAMEALYRHPWPGNVRELRTTIMRAAELAPGSEIRTEHLRIRPRESRAVEPSGPAAAEMILIPPEGKPWKEVEAEMVLATLRLTGGNRSAAARILGISRPTLGRKIRKYGVTRSLSR